MYIDLKHGCILCVRLIINLGILCNLWVVNCSYLVVWVVASYNHIMLTARTMIRYDWNGLATPAWGSQTEVEYQLVVGTSVGVPTISPSANWCHQ